MDDYYKCDCGSHVVFSGFRGLNVVLRCTSCGAISLEPHPYAGLEEDLYRER